MRCIDKGNRLIQQKSQSSPLGLFDFLQRGGSKKTSFTRPRALSDTPFQGQRDDKDEWRVWHTLSKGGGDHVDPLFFQEKPEIRIF